MTEQTVLQTSRLVLRPFTLHDAPAVQALAGAREIADTTLHIPHPYPEGAAERWIGSHGAAWQAGTGAAYAITDTASGTLIGAIGLSFVPEHACAELGYWVAVPYWNRGYCTEAGRALLALAFDVLRLERVQARHFTRNPASGRVMRKLGMLFEGVHRRAMLKWDSFEDLAMYAILADEWRAEGEQAASSRHESPGVRCG